MIQLTRYMPLSALAEVEKDHVCDIVAILKDAGEAGEIIGKQSQRAVSGTSSVSDPRGRV